MKNLPNSIDFAEKKFVGAKSGNLVGIEIKDYPDVQRWFFLYKNQNSLFNYRRIIVDYVFKNYNFIAVDFSKIKNPEEFDLINWKEVEDHDDILSQYPRIYSLSNNYN